MSPRDVSHESGVHPDSIQSDDSVTKLHRIPSAPPVDSDHMRSRQAFLSPEQQDGISTPTRSRFVRDAPGLLPGDRRSGSSSPMRLSMPMISPGQLAFSALQFLPMPMLVLNGLKTVVLANEAMGRLLGMVPDNPGEHFEGITSILERLRGQSLSQVGIDMLQDGRPVWVSWETFLDSVAYETAAGKPTDVDRSSKEVDGDATPKFTDKKAQSSTENHRPSQNVVVEVVVSRKDLNKASFGSRLKSRTSDFQAHAKMIITAWEVEDHQTFFTLTFTSSDSAAPSVSHGRKSIARSDVLEAADRKTISRSNPPSVNSSRDSSSPSYRISPGAVSVSSSTFPPLGPPARSSSMSSTPSILQKIITMKDALLDNTEMPILAMWKDGSVAFPNAAARKLLLPGDVDHDALVDGYDLLPHWAVYDEEFTRKLAPEEYPISVLISTERPFPSFRIGMHDREGKRHVFDVLGEAIQDDSTGEFLAGVVTCRDVTNMTQMITQIKEQDAERFKLICDTMPQLVWTATPDGYHDFFNSRWYSYTGLSQEDSFGMGWKLPFHPDDMPETVKRWNHSLKTGAPYVTEYRCRSKEGEWRWFLGRALPLRNKDTGEIEKWFGKLASSGNLLDCILTFHRHLH